MKTQTRLRSFLLAELLNFGAVLLLTSFQPPSGAGRDSPSEILRRPVLHIIGQQSYLAGSTAAVRVIVTDSRNVPLTGEVQIRGSAQNSVPSLFFTGRLNPTGSTEAQFRLPAGLTGPY